MCLRTKTVLVLNTGVYSLKMTYVQYVFTFILLFLSRRNFYLTLTWSKLLTFPFVRLIKIKISSWFEV